MPSSFDCLPYVSQMFAAKKTSHTIGPNNITWAPSQKWQPIEGPVLEALLQELQKMYWQGVKRELGDIILTMNKWQSPEYAAAILDDEEDDFIHGFDTFVDQVSEKSREFAQRYNEKVRKWKRGASVPYEEALTNMGRDIEASLESESLKADIRDTLEARRRYTIEQRRARMLLQSSGFIDIDKLIEYRPPEEQVTFWKRPVAPQLTRRKSNDSYMPSFKPLACSRCNHTIRGCMFKNAQEESMICESCYREHHYQDDQYMKVYKHCALNGSAITPEDCQRICKCSTVFHSYSGGAMRQLFPVDLEEPHRGSNGGKGLRCGLLNLGEHIAEAKYDGMQSKHEKYISLSDQRHLDWKRKDHRSYKISQVRELRVAHEKALTIPREKRGKDGISAAFEEDLADNDVPLFLRKFTNRDPFGNVHMALRVGPLIIETGMEHVRGALITTRDSPNFQVLRYPCSDIEYSLALIGDTDRSLHYQYRTGRKPKRYKAIMKQVAGGAFSGLENEPLETVIVDTLLSEARRKFDMTPADRESMLHESADKLLLLMKRLIGSKVEIYLHSVATRLLNPSTNLHWNLRTNNCQHFCDALLDHDLFGPLVAPSEKDADPLYLMSFVARPGSYKKESVATKFDVPNGLIEEYLLRFRYGRHDESDVLDTLQEYWHDWGAFDGHIYKYGDVLPWDCTEAFGRYPTVCNDCNISKHAWAFPFDSFSLCALNLTRDRHLYPSLNDEEPRQLSDLEWMHNRLTVLLAQDVLLTAAAAMAKTSSFYYATSWIHQHANPKTDRFKLGGIHRAQPFSHSFDQGKHHRYFVADWVHLKREQKIQAYEALRDGRVKMSDVPGVPSEIYNNDGGGGCGGCTVVVCGGGCGSGCAIACGGDGGGDGGDGGGDGGGCGGCGG